MALGPSLFTATWGHSILSGQFICASEPQNPLTNSGVRRGCKLTSRDDGTKAFRVIKSPRPKGSYMSASWLFWVLLRRIAGHCSSGGGPYFMGTFRKNQHLRACPFKQRRIGHGTSCFEFFHKESRGC